MSTKAMHRLTGTSHFVSLEAAVEYYKPYGFDALDVGNKLAVGEIKIGQPTWGKGQTLKVEGGRYFLKG